MRFPGILIAFLLLLAACRKDDVSLITEDALKGEWKLVVVKDKNTGAEYFRPPGSSGNAIIRFDANSFSGHTLINSLSGGTYTLQNGRNITFGDFAMTKVMEDEWGSMFLTVLQACGLQSSSPCAPSKISFQGAKLVIQSPLRYDLTLIRN